MFRLPLLLVVGFSMALHLVANPIQLTSGYKIEQNEYRSGTLGGVGVFSASTALSDGFVNVFDASNNWLVQNLPVGFGMTEAPWISDSMELPVPDGVMQGSISGLKVEYDTVINTSGAPTVSGATVSVGIVDSAIGGVDNIAPMEGRFLPPVIGGNPFGNNIFELNYQFGHPNVQAALNQCAPAAVANSLQWLENTYGLNVPHPNDKGLKGDGTLVGQLDTTTGRNVTSRAVGGGVWPFDGKLEYLSLNGLSGLDVRHQSAGGGDGLGGALGGGDTTRHGIKSKGEGAPSFDFILKQIKAGEDVEIDYAFPCKRADGTLTTCRHYVNVTGAGYIGGRAFITHVSDYSQSDKDPTDTKGTDRIDRDWVDNGNLLPNQGGAVIDQVITESVPEPGSFVLVASAAALLALSRWRRRTITRG